MHRYFLQLFYLSNFHTSFYWWIFFPVISFYFLCLIYLIDVCGTPGYLAPEVLKYAMIEGMPGFSFAVDEWVHKILVVFIFEVFITDWVYVLLFWFCFLLFLLLYSVHEIFLLKYTKVCFIFYFALITPWNIISIKIHKSVFCVKVFYFLFCHSQSMKHFY